MGRNMLLFGEAVVGKAVEQQFPQGMLFLNIRRLAVMWCVVYAGEGREQKTEELIRARLPGSVCSRCFHLVQRFVCRRQGKVVEMARDCFPGYVFLETKEPETVQKTLKNTGTSLLFSDGSFVASLDREEEALLGLLCDNGGEIGLSVARVSVDGESGRKAAVFLSGPLSKVADKVAHVDFHKRCARLEGSLLEGKNPLKLGFCFEGEQPVGGRGHIHE